MDRYQRLTCVTATLLFSDQLGGTVTTTSDSRLSKERAGPQKIVKGAGGFSEAKTSTI